MPELPENGPGTVWFATVNVTSVCLTGLSRRGVFISHYALSLCALTLMFYFGCTDEWCLTFSHSHMIISTDYLLQTEFIVGKFSPTATDIYTTYLLSTDLKSQVLPHMRNVYAMGPVCPVLQPDLIFSILSPEAHAGI